MVECIFPLFDHDSRHLQKLYTEYRTAHLPSNLYGTDPSSIFWTDLPFPPQHEIIQGTPGRLPSRGNDLDPLLKQPPTYPKHQQGLIRLLPILVVPEIVTPNCHLDVIAVHGLNGDAYTTWLNKRGELWLEKYLPNSLPGARIYTFGYDSSIFGQSTATIADDARKLLSQLELVRGSKEVCYCPSAEF
jgi:hypothetical protein